MGLLTRRAALRALGVAGVVGFGGCSRLPLGGGPNEQPPDSIGTDWVPPDDEWRLPAADLRNTARSSFAIEEQPVIAWHTAPSRGTTERAVPVATRDMVISTRRHAEQTIIRAHDATDGTVRWRRQFQSDQLEVGGLVDGTLLVSDDHRSVVALAASEGTTQWRRNLYAHVAADVPERFLFGERFVHLTLLPTPEAVYVQTDYGVHGLAPTDGREQWRLYLGDLINDGSAGPLDRSPSGLALVDEVLWASYGGAEATLLTVSMSGNGPTVDSMTPPQHNANRPVGTKQMVCLAHQASFATTGVEGSLVSGFDGSGENVEWQFPGLAVNGKPWGSSAALATDGDRVFVCQVHIEGQTVAFATMALDAATGGLEWMVREPLGDFDPRQHSSELYRHVTLCQPAVAGRTLVVGYGTSTQLGDNDQGPSDGTLLGLSTRTGTEHWRRPLKSAPSDLSVAGNRVYVGGARGEITAVSLSGTSDQLSNRRLE